jgi:hypothetical protein
LIFKGNIADHESEEVSEHATCSISVGVRAGEYPTCEKEIYEHPWDDIRDSDDDSIANNSDGQVGTLKVEGWLAGSS